MRIWEQSAASNADDAECPKSSVGYVQLFSVEISTALKITALFAHPFQVRFMNCSSKYRRWPNEQRHTVVGFLSVMVGVDLIESGSPVEFQWSGCCLTGNDEVHVEETRWFSLQENAPLKMKSNG